MGDPLVQDYLQGVVVGTGAVRRLVYEVDVRKFGGVLPGFGRRTGCARVRWGRWRK